MKRMMIFVFIMLAACTMLSAKEFTLMVYIGADNNLSGYANPDIDEMEAAYGNLTSRMDIVICVDGYASYGGYDDEAGNHSDTRYYHLSGGGNGTDGIINEVPATGSPNTEKNMADPQTLIDFADWVDKNYNADEYGLIMWNHGAGWGKSDLEGKGGISDETNSDFMSGAAGEWRDALLGARNELKQDFYFIGCDMCVMSYMEVLWDVYDICGMYVASEANIALDGWYYDEFITSLATSAPSSPSVLGDRIVDDYHAYYPSSSATLTYMVIDEAQINYLKSQIFSLAQYLIVDEGGRGDTYVQSCIDGAQEMASGTFYEDFKDIWHFCYLLYNNANIGARVKEYAYNIMNTIDDMNPHDWQNGFPNSHGLGIYLPDDANIYYFEEEYDSPNHRWGASSLYNGSSNGACYPWTNFIYGSASVLIQHDLPNEPRQETTFRMPNFYISTNMLMTEGISEVILKDVLGKTILYRDGLNYNESINLDLIPGVYFIIADGTTRKVTLLK